MKILLQFPEGLKKEAIRYADRYRKEGHEIILSASACYGGCDLAFDEARAVGAEKIVHFGHAPFLRSTPIPVEYVEWHENVNLENIAKAAKKIKEKKLALATTVQHIHQLNEIKKIFEKEGKEVLIGKGSFTTYEGQILGCDFGAIVNNKAEAAVIVASGRFHAAGAFVEYPVYSVHPQTGETENLAKDLEKAKKIRKAAILKALEARNFGVLVSTKPGQFRLSLANEIAKKIRSHGRNAEVIVANELNAGAINNFMFDALINTACPRIADDRESYNVPVINADCVDELFKLWADLKRA